MRHAGRSAFIAGGLVLLLVGVAPAQSRTSSSSGSSGSSGSFTGSSSGSSGSFTGSSSGSSGSFTGSSSGSSGSFTGSSGSGASSGSGNSSGGSSSNPGSTTQFGRYYGNPLYNGLATSSGSSASSTGSKYLRAAPVSVNLGNPLYNAASLNTTSTRGSTGIGTQGTGTTFAGANSAGIRRSPGYVTEAVFEMPARATLETMRPELQSVLSRATRLPSRDSIRVTTDGDTVVLRGQVRDERERRLAEAMIRLSPGVRLVRNELKPVKKP